ncbi:MAG: hypothetical protein DYG91_14740, partial [Chloroflexi bacterium CFX7]|nr:hypothetical protein [Chloroflexi bacterium CFX7]
MTLSNAANDQVYPAVAYDSQANVFEVVWSDRRDGSSYDIYGQQVTANGLISGSHQLLAGSGDSANLTWPRIASHGSSQFLATWQREVSSSDHNVHALRVSAANGQAVGSVLNIDTAAGKENTPAVTGTGGGEYLLLWRDDGVIEAQRIGSDGSLLGSVLTLSEATGGIRKEPAVAHGSGQSLGVWSDTSQSGQYSLTGRRVADNGSLTGAEIFISPYYSRREWTALAPSPTSSESLLAWQQAAAAPTTDIFIQRVDSQGQALGNPLNVTNQAAAQEYPALAAGSQGYLAVWRDARNAASGLDIYGQLLTASATPTGSLIA